MSSTEPNTNIMDNFDTKKHYYELLKIEEYEKNGLFLESYSAKLVYHAGYYSIFYGVLSKLIFKRFSLGFAFGFGYGSGQIHNDFIRAFNKGLQNPPHFDFFKETYDTWYNYFYPKSNPVDTETPVAEVNPSTSQENTQETLTKVTATHNSETVNNEVQNPIVNSEQAPKNL